MNEQNPGVVEPRGPRRESALPLMEKKKITYVVILFEISKKYAYQSRLSVPPFPILLLRITDLVHLPYFIGKKTPKTKGLLLPV
jgi:hypothetical protein